MLHPDRIEALPPRRRAHITLIRWIHTTEGDWSYECETGHFESADDGIWTVSNGEQLKDFDMTIWSLCAN